MKQGNGDQRKDTELRAAMKRINNEFYQLSNADQIYQRLLHELCQLTASTLAFVIEQQYGPHPSSQGLNLIAQTVIHSHTIVNEAALPIALDDNFSFLHSLFVQGSSCVFDVTQLHLIQHSHFGWPKLKSMIAMPLLFGVQTKALICLANSKAPYHINLSRRVWPLLTTSACLLKLIHTKKTPSDNVPLKADTGPWDMLGLIEMASPMGMITIDKHHQITKMNPAARTMFAIGSHQEVTGRSIKDFIPERFPNEHRAHTFSLTPSDRWPMSTLTLSGYRSDGTTFPIELSLVHFQVQHQPYFLLMLNTNATVNDFKAVQEAQTQRFFKTLSDLAPIGILQTNQNWECVYANDRWCDISGYHQDTVLGMGWINSLFNEDVADTLESLRHCIVNGSEFHQECRFQTPEDEIVWVELHARPLFTPQGDIDGFLATLTDCTYRHTTEDKLRIMAERDGLTGLANRTLFLDRLTHALTRTERHGALALLCLDLDGFKTVNDTLGHDAGDALLIEVSQRIQQCVREEDTVARIGGDEFMIILEGLPYASAASNVSEKILKYLEAPIQLMKQEVYITTSIGITFSLDNQPNQQNTLIKQADIALYRAKAEGKNNYQYYSPELELASKDRLYLTNSLHKAIQRHEFQVYYQLQAEGQSSAIVGSEALLRWQHPERGLLSPTEFIDLLDETGLIAQVSRWLWSVAFADHKRWIDNKLIDHQSRISVNLSPRQLRDPQLIHNLKNAMQISGLRGDSIMVELTESALLDQSQKINECLQAMQALGIKIALDDFGTGYSSLTYLKRFSIDCLKIDQTFIRDILTDPEDCEITKAVIALAQSLRLISVAEGVDHVEKLKLLKQWGCQHYQGYYLNEPCPSKDIEQLLLQHLPSTRNPIEKRH